VVRVGGVAENAVVLLIERVHRPPRERDLAVEHRRVLGKGDVLPGTARCPAHATDDLEPGGLAEVAVLAAVIGRSERAVGQVGKREVRDRVAAGLEEQHGVVALHHSAAAKLGTQPAPQRLGVQHSFRHAGHQELPVGVAAQRPSLP
jgi:hypothetical protein